jgi:RND family efflux transporter MFP subunit
MDGDSNHSRSVSPPRGRGRVGLMLVVAGAVAFAGLLGVRVKQATAKRANVAAERASAEANAKVKEPLRTAKAEPTKWMPRVDFLGTLKPWREADVGFEVPGKLVQISVAIGDKVKGGQVLAVLDASQAVAQVGQAESQVSAAQANLAMAQDDLKRTEALVASKSMPEAQAEQARQRVALAKAQLEGAVATTRVAKTGAGQRAMSAPFAGIVTKAPTGIGSVVNPGMPLVHIEDNSRFRLSATIGEEDVPLVIVGAKVHVVYREKLAEGKVVAVVPSLDQGTRRAPVEIEVPNPENSGLLAWGFVKGRIYGAGEVDAVKVPATARRPGSQDQLVTVENGVVKIKQVSFAVDTDGTLIVQRGLTAGETVLISPNVDLKDGDKVDAQAPGK